MEQNLNFREDERVTQVLSLLERAESREEIARRFQMTNRKSLDQYMRRYCYVWNDRYSTYLKTPKHPLYDERQDPLVRTTPSARVRKVVELFSLPGADAKTIARKLQFLDHREMASYMGEKGYAWSAEVKNYIRVKPRRGDEDSIELSRQVGSVDDPVKDEEAQDVPLESRGKMMSYSSPQVDWGRYVPVLQLLLENETKIKQLLGTKSIGWTHLIENI